MADPTQHNRWQARAWSVSSPRPLLPAPERRSLAFSYLLWCLCLVGLCGVQRIYNRKPLSGMLWLFSFGLCGVGQLIDLLLLPRLVRQANQSLPPPPPVAAATVAIERQLLALARRSGARGFTINDAVLELPPGVDSTLVREEIQRLLHSELLEVGNDERGRVVYREP